ncbi:hypothetical protein ACFCZ6_32525 [Streptomyces hydrogenans]|uniref:hypothetical protein n=1 Tax=Streptomyces hydrogenans TaxID=1873719 RepID=UPI0035D8C542
MTGTDDRLREAARDFLSAAWARLEQERVVPPPAFRPYLEIGHDYFGDSVMPLPAFRTLEAAISAAHPRFSPVEFPDEQDFPGGLIFSFLEAFIARLTLAGEDFSVTGTAAAESLQDLVQVVHSDSFEVACCRLVSHLTTADGAPVDFTHVRVEPIVAEPARHQADLQRIISEAVPGASGVYARDWPYGFAPPESVITARDSGPKPHALGGPLSERIERFLLLVRLLKPGISESMAEIRGESRLVRDFGPTVIRFRGAGPGLSSARRGSQVITLDRDDAGRIDGLDRLLAAAQQPPKEMAFTSFGMALHKFLLSFHAHVWSEQIVDLATAFEATLSGTATADVTLRLKLRASVLLCGPDDPAEQIFNDVGAIYNLRSYLVHGGALSMKALRKELRKVSTVSDGMLDAQAIARTVERLRDLVRRSLLARICLAAGAEPLWPLATDQGVDAAMVSDESRRAWRERWRDTLAGIDAGSSADRASA